MTKPVGNLTVGPEEAGLPLDRFLIRHLPEMTRAKIRLAFEGRRLLVNGNPPERPGAGLQAGDHVELTHVDADDSETPHLLFEDPAFLVAFKPAGMPASRHPLAAARGRGVPRQRSPARVVLSVDDRVSGVMVAATHPQAARLLSQQFSGGGAHRRFTALVGGGLHRPAGPLEGAAGWTYKLLRRYREAVLLQLTPPPARQADVVKALAAAHLEIKRLPGPGPLRLAIHAAGVSFTHPRTGRRLSFDVPPPSGMRRLLDSLEPVPTLAADVPATPPHGPPDQAERPDGPEPALRSPREIRQRGGRRD